MAKGSVEYLEREAERARLKRARLRLANPVKPTRTFTCRRCQKTWETADKGNFHHCPTCKVLVETEKEAARRNRPCHYCGKAFKDESLRNTRKYCSDNCFYRHKAIGAGLVSEQGFLEDQVLACKDCSKEFTPVKGNQVYCSDECRLAPDRRAKEAARHKICTITGASFYDSSLRNNRRYADEALPFLEGYKDPTREAKPSLTLEQTRRSQVRSGGGRIDDITTLNKHTNTWWGRVGELIYAKYRPEAEDMVVKCSNISPYDFQDPDYKRVDVKTTALTLADDSITPSFIFGTKGVDQSCDHAFLVGFSDDRKRLLRMWLVPSSEIKTCMRLTPGSKVYNYGPWDVTESWGLEQGQGVLDWALSLPGNDKEYRALRIGDPLAWMDDIAYLEEDDNACYRGRKGELQYKAKYPDSKDKNRELGTSAPYDFEDPDGTKVNVKTSRPMQKGRATKWSFGLGSSSKSGHKCDVYSCLCLDASGALLREYRIPASIWGARRTIHIYDAEDGGLWSPYLV